jgi:hypothetical protein
MKSNSDTPSLRQRQGMIIMTVILVATLSTLLVTMTVIQVAFAGNLNNSKSNVYRSTQNVESNEGGPVEQTSTSTDESITTIENTNTNTASIECDEDCDADINQVN